MKKETLDTLVDAREEIYDRLMASSSDFKIYIKLQELIRELRKSIKGELIAIPDKVPEIRSSGYERDTENTPLPGVKYGHRTQALHDNIVNLLIRNDTSTMSIAKISSLLVDEFGADPNGLGPKIWSYVGHFCKTEPKKAKLVFMSGGLLKTIGDKNKVTDVMLCTDPDRIKACYKIKKARRKSGPRENSIYSRSIKALQNYGPILTVEDLITEVNSSGKHVSRDILLTILRPHTKGDNPTIKVTYDLHAGFSRVNSIELLGGTSNV